MDEKKSKKTPSGEKKMDDHLAVKQKINNVSQFHTRQNEKLTLFLLCSSTFACEFTNLISVKETRTIEEKESKEYPRRVAISFNSVASMKITKEMCVLDFRKRH